MSWNVLYKLWKMEGHLLSRAKRDKCRWSGKEEGKIVVRVSENGIRKIDIDLCKVASIYAYTYLI